MLSGSGLLLASRVSGLAASQSRLLPRRAMIATPHTCSPRCWSCKHRVSDPPSHGWRWSDGGASGLEFRHDVPSQFCDCHRRPLDSDSEVGPSFAIIPCWAFWGLLVGTVGVLPPTLNQSFQVAQEPETRDKIGLMALHPKKIVDEKTKLSS